MWNDHDTPGCLYDTIDCSGSCCDRGREMFDAYLNDRYEGDEEMARVCDHCGRGFADGGTCFHCNPGMAITGHCAECHETIDLSGKTPHHCKKGAKWDDGKCDWSFLPSKPIEEVLKIYAGGAKKYGRGNYLKGIHYSRVFSAAMRHLWAWWRCEGADKESGMSHLAHACWNILTLLEYTQNSKYEKFDDRVLDTFKLPSNTSGTSPLKFDYEENP